MNKIDLCLQIAVKAHEGQKDKNGEPYILHPLTVGLMGTTDETKMAGFLHDVVEDCDWTFKQLSEAGVPDEVVAALKLLTHTHGEDYMTYVQRIVDSGNAIALQVKRNDLTHNLHRANSNEYFRNKYEPALALVNAALEEKTKSKMIKMKKTTFRSAKLFLSAILATITATAQINSVPSIENNADPEKAAVFELWKNYLESRPDSLYDNPFWNDEDKRTLPAPDLLAHEGFLSPGLYQFFDMGYQNTVLEIRREGDRYVIRSMFSYPTENGPFVLAITNHVAKKTADGTYRLHNWADYHTRTWSRHELGEIEYIYYPEYPFNPHDALKANDFIQTLRTKLGAKIDRKIRYCISSNWDETCRLKGFDFLVSMGDHIVNTGGTTDRRNSIIYADAVRGAYYQHEFCRLLGQTYPDAHPFIHNGIAEYLNDSGMQLGLPHREHFRRMAEYLAQHPADDILDLENEAFYTGIPEVAPLYLVGMILCRHCIEKGGTPLLRQALATPREAFPQFLRDRLQIKDFNKYIRATILRYSKEDMPHDLP